LKNIHTRLFLLILVLLAGAVYVVAKYPTRKGLDIQGGMRVVLRAKTEELKKGAKWDDDKLSTVASIMRKRVDKLGVAEPIVYPRPGENRIIVELPGLKNEKEALEAVQSTASLEFRYLPELADRTWTTRDETDNSGQSTGFEQILKSDGKPVSKEELADRVFSKDPLLAGDMLKPNARADIGTGKPVIQFEFVDGPEGKGKFEEFTRGHIGKPLAVFLDKKLISAPVIENVIPGEGIIQGNFTAETAKRLADFLNAGALPVPLEIMEQVKIEATLGTQAVRQTTLAGIIGLALVLLFMLVWYRLPGLLANISLCLYTLFTFAIFKGAFSFLDIPAVTLTVPGIAGFILSIGMAVDANILIFERMREERQGGKSLRAAIESGFKRAFTAIFDSNVCTLITCAVLYNFGSGQVRGFAVTLAIGVLVSMFTAITCTRTFLLLVAGTKLAENEGLFAVGRGFHPRLNVSKRMALWFGISGAIMVPGLIAISMGGIKPNIEFTGGTETTAQFTRQVPTSEITSTLERLGHKEARIVRAENNTAYITTERLSEDQVTAVRGAITQLGGSTQSVATVSGAISAELTRNAILAVVYASVLIILYMAFRFSIPNFVEGLKYGVCAVAALIHDAVVLLGAMAIFGKLLNWQIDSMFVTAMLTVIGFSVHDTIIIFDRIRENLRHKQRGETFAEVADRSIEQTFSRSINTSGTVVLTLVSLLIWGGPIIKPFVTAMLIGIISGTYSSIFNATPLLILWKRLSGDREVATAGAAAAPAAKPAPQRTSRQQFQPKAKPATVPQTDGTAGDGLGTVAPEPATAGPAGGAAAARIQSKKRKRRG
jgi:SecD/SecF fusion protein